MLHHVREIHKATADNDDNDDLTPDVDGLVAEVEQFFDMGDSQNTFDHFKALTECTYLNHIGVCALKVLQLIQLGKVEKGAISIFSKVSSRHGRWFSQKEKSVLVGDNVDGSVDFDICTQRDSIVQVKCIPYVGQVRIC